jgi:hypothetical protein
LITDLYRHAAALAQAGDVDAARVAHEAAGRLLEGLAPADSADVVDMLKHKNKPEGR